MFNDKLKNDVRLLRDQVKFLDTRLNDTLYKRIAGLEEDFRLLLEALNMTIREEFKVPRHIAKRPDPAAQECCSIADPAASLTTTEIRLADVENELSNILPVIGEILDTLNAVKRRKKGGSK